MSYSSSSHNNSWFIPGYGISRSVIQTEIQYMCGPDSIVRPFTLRGRDGYLVTSSGPTLSDEQIDDLKYLSLEYERKQAHNHGEIDGALNRPVTMRGRRTH